MKIENAYHQVLTYCRDQPKILPWAPYQGNAKKDTFLCSFDHSFNKNLQCVKHSSGAQGKRQKDIPPPTDRMLVFQWEMADNKLNKIQGTLDVESTIKKRKGKEEKLELCWGQGHLQFWNELT